jgi:DsbE subfamily thiol:disulfide oxidoreductase
VSSQPEPPLPLAPRVVRALALILPAVAILGAGLAIWLHQGAEGALGPADFVASPVSEDRPAPDFEIQTLDGNGQLSVTAFRGKVVVLNLWASWCVPCRTEAQALESVWREFAGRGVQVIGVDHADTRGDARAFQREFGLSYPMAFDPKGSVAAAYGALGIPTTYVISAHGRITYRFLGRATTRDLSRIVEQVLTQEG